MVDIVWPFLLFFLDGFAKMSNCTFLNKSLSMFFNQIFFSDEVLMHSHSNRYIQVLVGWKSRLDGGNRRCMARNYTIIEPYCWNATFLDLKLIPELTRLFPDVVNPPLMNRSISFNQDGATPHYYIRELLDVIFPNRWIGRRTTNDWPARSSN